MPVEVERNGDCKVYVQGSLLDIISVLHLIFKEELTITIIINKTMKKRDILCLVIVDEEKKGRGW